MAGKYSWKSVAETAKKWVDNKVTQTVTADRRTRQRTEGNEWRIEKEMEENLGGAILTTAFPGLGRAMERQEENRARAEQESSDRARARRLASVLPGSSIEVAGHVTARLDDVAVTLTPDDESRTLTVLMEPVDPARVAEAGFALTNFSGAGEYPLSDDIESLDPGVHHVVLDGGDSEDAWFYWVEEYGPGRAVVTDDLIECTLVTRNASGQEIHVRMRVPLA